MKTITLVGDSVLHRMVRNEPLLHALQIKDYFPDYSIENLAVGGSNSHDTLNSVIGYDFNRSDAIIVSIGLNDAAPWKQVPLDVFIANYENIIKLIDKKYIVLIIPNLVDATLQTQPGRDNAIIEEYNQAIINLAKKYGLQILNLYELIKVASVNNSVYYEDGVHLNERGYAVLIDELEKLIESTFN